MKINKDNLKVDNQKIGEIIEFTISQKETYIKYEINGYIRQLTVETEAISFE